MEFMVTVVTHFAVTTKSVISCRGWWPQSRPLIVATVTLCRPSDPLETKKSFHCAKDWCFHMWCVLAEGYYTRFRSDAFFLCPSL